MPLHAGSIIIVDNRVTNRRRCTMLDYVLNDDCQDRQLSAANRQSTIDRSRVPMTLRISLQSTMEREIRGSNLGEGEDFYLQENNLSPLFNFHTFSQTRKGTPARIDEKKRAREG